MNWGLDWMKFVAARVAEWSEGAGGIHAAPLAALILVAAGFLWLTLWRERWRFAGLVPIAGALLLTSAAPRPDILVAESGRTIAVRGVDGRLHIAGGKGASFEVEAWLRADADERDAGAADLADGVGCDPWGCIATLADGSKVALVLEADAFAEDCIAAAVVVSRLPAPPGCAEEALVIDRDRLTRHGAHALRREAREPPPDPAAKADIPGRDRLSRDPPALHAAVAARAGAQ
jgi:competence protein ComEC